MPGRLRKFIGQRQDENQARDFLGPRPVKEEGESIASFNQRLGKFQRDFQTIVTGIAAKERAAAARTPGLTDEQSQFVWWNGPNEEDTPGFGNPATPPVTPPRDPNARDPNARKYDLTSARLNPLGLQTPGTAEVKPYNPAPIITGAADLAGPKPIPGPVGPRESPPNPAMGGTLPTTPTKYTKPNPTKPRPFTMGGLFQ